jgi:hypothetical protein
VYHVGVSPGGHLFTTLAACGASLFLTRELPPAPSLTLAAGIAAGGFLIDVDHAVDYVLFERRRALTPSAFLRHYLEGRMRRTVLVLHSYEVFALLGLLAWRLDALALWGYLMGALMHLALDIVFNGELTPRSITAFYSFTYRLVQRFDAGALLGLHGRVVPVDRLWVAVLAGSLPPAAASPSPPRVAPRLAPSQGDPVA